MGEIADMMLDGTLCATCGTAMDDVIEDDFDAPGFPRYCCMACEPADIREQGKIPCPQCNKRVKRAGLADHMRVKHGMTP